MRLGFGFVFERGSPALRAAAAAGLGTGPPDPSVPLTPDAWIARFADLTLLERPGTVWRYDVAYDVLGVVLARAGRRPLGELLREQLLDPLGLADTAFRAPPVLRRRRVGLGSVRRRLATAVAQVIDPL